MRRTSFFLHPERNAVPFPSKRRPSLATLIFSLLVSLPVLSPLLLGLALGPSACLAAETSQKLHEIAALEDMRADVKVVSEFLNDPDPLVRSRAAEALGRIQDSLAIEHLVRSLKDASPDVRSSSAFALGQIGSLTASKALRGLLGDKSSEVKTAAVEALGKLKDRKSVKRISRFLRSSDRTLARQAALSLAAIGDSTALSALWRAAESEDGQTRWRVAYCFERIPHEKSLGALSGLAGDSEWLVRNFVARALGKVPSEEAFSLLETLLEDEDWHVRASASRALGSFENEQAASALASALSDRSPHVKVSACAALGQIRLESSTEPLRVVTFDSSPYVRAEAAKAMLLCGKEQAAGSALLMLEDEVWFVRAALYEAFGEVGIPEAPRVLLKAYAEETDARAKAAVVVGVGKTKNQQFLRPLAQAAADSDMVLVASVCEAFGEIGEPRAVGVVRQIYETWKDHREPDVKIAALEALKKLRAVGALEIFRESLFDRESRVREIAHEALGELWGRSAADSLRALSMVALARPTVVPEGYGVVGSSRARRAEIVTDRGVIVVRLLGTEAPNTVENFARLAAEGFYDGLTFHRVVPNFVIQGGCPRGDGWGGPGYTIRCEINRRHYLSGAVGMALAGKDTGGSQFFITHSPQPHLDGRYTIFGEVVEGMDIVESIQRGDRITEVRISED
ncbi:MAG: HEAT repeat domain-containing protein [Candidatus Eiseniibacteriota bacterium]|nr:MAG: HEAT repeat domain-containing protein [Candidatus Eisenbacteria bacterium]